VFASVRRWECKWKMYGSIICLAADCSMKGGCEQWTTCTIGNQNSVINHATASLLTAPYYSISQVLQRKDAAERRFGRCAPTAGSKLILGRNHSKLLNFERGSAIGVPRSVLVGLCFDTATRRHAAHEQIESGDTVTADSRTSSGVPCGKPFALGSLVGKAKESMSRECMKLVKLSLPYRADRMDVVERWLMIVTGCRTCNLLRSLQPHTLSHTNV
jgi:hypothetical protein